MNHFTRRGFFTTTGTAAVALALGESAGRSAGGATRDGTSESERDGSTNRPLDRQAIEAEIRRRADRYLAQDRLVVDYYRIRRKLAYPLPIESLSLPKIEVPSIPVYPWATWMTWELEQRVGSLGWAGEWFGDKRARTATIADLTALAGWPKYAQYGGPDLSSGHAGRLMWLAHSQWPWLGESLRSRLREACRRHVDEVLPGSSAKHGKYNSTTELLAAKTTGNLLHNIPFIGTIGAALTAHVADHPAAERLDRRVAMIFQAILERRKAGHAEGVGYDGYLLDFVADWLSVVDKHSRNTILEHPRLADYLDESYMLSAPGAAEQVAPLSDVEPREMPFHLSAQAKLVALQPNPVREWHLSRCQPEWLRTDALAALRPVADGLSDRAPKPGALDAHYAVVLRSGWKAEDLAVVMARSNSPMGHIQRDNGSILIGTHGRWLITDPGYQQYVQGAERDFTLGPTAHNAPVINGQCQNRKSPQRRSLRRSSDHVCQAVIELAACYPPSLKAKSIVRTLWTVGTDLVVVADQVWVADARTIRYHWHGHPDAAWWSTDGWVLVELPDASLWLTSPQADVNDSQIQRLEGSRGQLTLVADADPSAPVIWWVFALGAQPPALTVRPGGKGIKVGSRVLNLHSGKEMGSGAFLMVK